MRHHAGSREITITISPESSKVKEPTKDHTAMFFFVSSFLSRRIVNDLH